jgi:hypothetical protein
MDLDNWSHRYELLIGAVIRHIILPELRQIFFHLKYLSDVAGETVIPRTRFETRVKCLQLQDRFSSSPASWTLAELCFLPLRSFLSSFMSLVT